MLTALIFTAIGFAAGYWVGEAGHPVAMRIRRFILRWWSP